MTTVRQSAGRSIRLAYFVSHPIQYQAPLLRRIAQQPGIELTVFFGSDFSVRGYKDEGFGVEVAWDTPLLEGYRHVFLPPLRDTGTVSATTPISREVYAALLGTNRLPAFDAVWVHGYATLNSLQVMAAAKAMGLPVLLRAESWLGDRPRSAGKLVAKRAFFAMLRPMVAAVLPIGTENAAYWREYFGSSMPQFLMPYAVDNAWFAAVAEAARPTLDGLRRELRLPANARVILFASKLQERKHCDHLVEAYAQAIEGEDAPPWLVIVGDGEERGRLERMVAERGLQTVRFSGFQNQTALPAFFALADVFVLPSRHEPWGLIVNEAMATGCPCIVSTDVGAHTDLIRDGVEGYTFPVGDVAALAARLREFFACSDAGMGERARERMRTWSFEEDVAGLRAALERVVRR